MIRVVLMAPIDSSLYARLVAYKLRGESEIQLAGILVRSPWNLNRIRSELRRDGSRLLHKVFEKAILGDRRYQRMITDNLSRLADRWDLPFRSLKQLAAEYNLPYQVVSGLNHIRSQKFLESIQPDLAVFTGGGLIRANILSIPAIGILNCHTGILPRYRGMDVVEWTAAEGQVRQTGIGVTAHLMDQGVDTGPILITRQLDLEGLNSFQEIRMNLEPLMVEAMIGGVRKFRDGNVRPIRQNMDAGRQYYVMHPRMKEYAKLQLLKQIRHA